MILAILTICLVSLTPLPSLPLVIYYYSKLGFIDGFIVVTVASNLKIFIHYNLGRLVRSNKINILNFGERISKIQKKYKSLPRYSSKENTTSSYKNRFEATCYVDEAKLRSNGTAKTRKGAELEAAAIMLKLMERNDF